MKRNLTTRVSQQHISPPISQRLNELSFSSYFIQEFQILLFSEMENTQGKKKITGPIKYIFFFLKKSFSFPPSAYFPYANISLCWVCLFFFFFFKREEEWGGVCVRQLEWGIYMLSLYTHVCYGVKFISFKEFIRFIL
jgi:hypothetical protein